MVDIFAYTLPLSIYRCSLKGATLAIRAASNWGGVMFKLS